jgi:hypothetical protein
MVIMKASGNSEAGVMPSEKLITEMTAYNEELVNAGIMLSGEGLHPSSKGARVKFSGDRVEVVKGPFANTEELIAGFWMWNVKSFDEAIDWAKRIPNSDGAHHTVELRPVFEAEDFGEALTPELRAREEELRARTEGK